MTVPVNLVSSTHVHTRMNANYQTSQSYTVRLKNNRKKVSCPDTQEALSHWLASHGCPTQGPIPLFCSHHTCSQAISSHRLLLVLLGSSAGDTATLRASRVCEGLQQIPALLLNPAWHLPNGLLCPVELLQDPLYLLVNLAVLSIHSERAPAMRGEAAFIKCPHNLSGPPHTTGAAHGVATGQVDSLLSH